jgi:M6 family metalloprotease-like protein
MRLASLLVFVAIAAGGVPVTAGGGPELQAAPKACTQAQKSTRTKALAAYRKLMPKQRKAYFKRVHSAKKRKAFVKKQQAKLKKLKAAAGCRVASPRPPAPRPPVPVPPGLPVNPPAAPPPAPPVETTAPTLTSATVAGATLTLGFDEAIASVAGAGVTADGLPLAVAGTTVSGATVILTLAAATDGGDVVLVNGRFRDAVGNEAILVSNGVTNLAGPSFSPALAKASWADDHSFASPEYGEWPIDHRYFLSPTRVRVVMIFVDFPDKKFTWTPQQIYGTWAPVSVPWFRRASFGRFDFGVDFVDRVYHMPRNSTEYGDLGGNDSSQAALKAVIAEAAGLADGDVDFSRYDAIWVVNPLGLGHGQWRAWPGEGFRLDGKDFEHGQFPTEFVLTQPFIGAEGHPVDNSGAAHMMLTHELGHHLGLPDLSYRPADEYDFTFVAGWDMQENPAGMLRGSDFLAWNKQRLGWIDPKQIRGLIGPGTLEETITPVESAGGVKLVVAQTSPTFLYAVEVRRRLGNDATMTCDEGVLVYTVDSTKRNGLGPKFVHAAQMGPDQSKVSTCGLKYAAPFDVGPGEVSVFEDSAVKVEVLSTDGVNYRVRVTRK